MSIFMVAWQFGADDPSSDHRRRRFHARLDGFNGYGGTGVDNVRLLSSGWDAGKLADHLGEVLRKTDALLIVQVIDRGGKQTSWLAREARSWIDRHGGGG